MRVIQSMFKDCNSGRDITHLFDIQDKVFNSIKLEKKGFLPSYLLKVNGII